MRVQSLLRTTVLSLGLVPGGALAQPLPGPLPAGISPVPQLPMPPQMPMPPPLPMPPPFLPAPPQGVQVDMSAGGPGAMPMGMSPGLTVYLRTTDLQATLSRLSGQQVGRVWTRRGSYLRTYDTWSPVCRAPCGVLVSPDDVFQIRGIGINASNRFMLPMSGSVSLDVNAGHSGVRTGGVLLTTFGGMATVVGLVFTPIGAALSSRSTTASTGAPGSTRSDGSGFLLAGGVTLGIGAAMLAGGITMLVLSRTTVRTREGYRLAALAKPPLLSFSSAGLHF